MTTTVVIVDDEGPARAILREACARHADLTVVAECAHGVEAAPVIDELRPDVVLLDVQMPRLTGFEMLDVIEHRPLVVFVTAYDEHALAAFDVHACDYLLKPFADARFDEAVERVRARLASGEPRADYGAVADASRPDAWLTRVAIRRGGEVEVVAVDALERLEARDDHVRLHAADDSWLKHKTLSWFAEHLDPARFVRVHRSHVIALDALERLETEAKDRHVAVLKSGARVAVSRAGMKRLEEHLR